MSAKNSMNFRPSALLPFVSSSIAFALILVLVLSGTHPGSIPDGYLLSFNTTSVGKNLVLLNPITPATTSTPAANAARDVLNRTNSNTTVSSSTNSSSSISNSPNGNVTISATSNSNSTSSAAPTLAIPQTSGTTNPAAIPISLIGTFFQLTLNTLASGMGQTFQGIISTLVTSAKTSIGVSQYYTMHVSGICQGSVLNTSGTNSTSPFNITRCVSYNDGATYIANLTSNVSDSALVAATNITVPFLSKVPIIGKSAKSLIDLISSIVLAVFIISLIGNGLSIILSVGAFVKPSNGKIHAIGAGVTTLSAQLLQVAAITSTTIAVSVSTAINGFSDVSGLRATIGSKFLVLIWFGYIGAQVANGYWASTWFVKFRTISYKARERTPQEMSAGYRGIKREILSDIRLQKVEYDDTEMLRKSRLDYLNIKHWNEPNASYKQI